MIVAGLKLLNVRLCNQPGILFLCHWNFNLGSHWISIEVCDEKSYQFRFFSEFCRKKSQYLSLGMLSSVLVMWVLLLQTPRRRWVSCLFVAVLYESNMIPICSGFDWIGGKQNFKRIRIFSPGLLRREGFHSSHSINEPIASCWQLLGYGARLLNEVPNCCLRTLS